VTALCARAATGSATSHALATRIRSDFTIESLLLRGGVERALSWSGPRSYGRLTASVAGQPKGVDGQTSRVVFVRV
jgi:hypothetical protein